jgi:HTH-type transcriptional regulator/antitoxin HigA
MTAAAKKRIDIKKYARLLTKALPRPIETEVECERVIEMIDKLMSKGEEMLTAEEHVLLELLTQLVERYEDEHHQIPEASPDAVIRFLMEDRGLRHKDLMPALGSRGVTSEVINGKRKPSRTQVKALADFFGVSHELFIDKSIDG